MRSDDDRNLTKWRDTRDAQAFQQLAAEYAGLVYGTCRRITGNPEDAEDATQECFLKLAKHPPAIRCSIGSWLHRVATNASISLVRSDSARKAREKRYQGERASALDPDWDDIQDLVDEAINALPRRFREPLIDHYLQGETHQAIARRMGLTRQVVTYRIGRGVETIRKSLKRKGVTIATSTLAGLLHAARWSDSVSASLLASLNKLGLAGVAPRGSAFTRMVSSLGGPKVAVGLPILAAAVAAVLWYASRSEQTDPATAVAPPKNVEAQGPPDKVITFVQKVSGNEATDPVVEIVAASASIEPEVQAAMANPDALEESPQFVITVSDEQSRSPLPGVRVTIYPDEAVEFSTVSDTEMPSFGARELETQKSVLAQATASFDHPELPWWFYARIMKFRPQAGQGFAFTTNEVGQIETDELTPGTYIAVVNSDTRYATGLTLIDLGRQGEATVEGYTRFDVFPGNDQQEFYLQTSRTLQILGRVYDERTGAGIPDVSIEALRLTDNVYLKIDEGRALTDGEGDYMLTGLPRGSYRIRRSDIPHMRGETSQEVTLSVARSDPVDFPVSGGAALSGTVYWGDDPAADIDFMLNYGSADAADGSKLLDEWLHTDQLGRYFVTGIEAFEGILHASTQLINNSTMFSRWVRDFSITEGEYKTVDIHFDVGAATVEGVVTQGGRPLADALVNWKDDDFDGMKLRTKTDAEGRYVMESIPSGRSYMTFIYPLSYNTVMRPIHVNDGEHLKLDVDIPSKKIRVLAKNVPYTSRVTWVSVVKGTVSVPKGTDYNDWLYEYRFDTVSRTRWIETQTPSLWGLEPGTYTLVATSRPNFGYFTQYLSDHDALEQYMDESIIVIQPFEVTESTSRVEVDFSDGKPFSDVFTLETE